METQTQATVLYNGDCPICSREIAAYRRRAERTGAALAFEDLNGADLGEWGLGEEDARRRLHVRMGDRVLAGLPAFVALWERLPGMGWLARLVSLPGIAWGAERVYEHVLAPALHWLDRRRRRTCASGLR
ncbi:MAG: thiol-disulfide oxidoreductase DCC family protein [Alkalilacustris sp.]